MKFTVVITIININKDTFDLIDDVYNQNINGLHIILSIPNIFNKKDINELKKYIKSMDNIEVIELKDDNINHGRNEAIKRSKSKYITFINSNEKISRYDMLQNIYNEMTNDKLDIINYDFTTIQKYDQNTFDIDSVKSKEFLESKTRFLESKIYNGKDFYSKCIQKKIFLDYLFTYSYKLEFIRKYNITFDEKLVNSTMMFVLNCLFCCENIKYLPCYFIKDHRYNSMFINMKFIKYNCIENTFYVIEQLIDKAIKFENIYLQKHIFDQLVTLLESTFTRVKENSQYYYIDRIYKYLNTIKLYITKKDIKDILDIEIKIDMIIDCFQTIERYRSYYFKYEGKNIYNDIYILQEIINNISICEYIDINNINILRKILNNCHYSKFKSTDILKSYFDKNNIKETNIDVYFLTNNMKELQKDIESIVNNKLIYYWYFEDKFSEVLKNI